MPSVYIKTYGCQMNVRDSEQVVRDLAAKGYELTENELTADVVLLNTCSVRDMAEQKALDKARNLTASKKKHPHRIVGFLGCMAQSRGSELLELLPKLDLVVGTQKFHRVADYVDTLFHSRQRTAIADIAPEIDSQNTIREHVLKARQATAFVSIMQGCNMHCAFCIVPSTRGAERSRPMAEIVTEVEGLVAQGVKEVTLLGQIVNLYGRHEFPVVKEKSPFVQLLHAVCGVAGLQRVRFTSPHPIGFKKDLVQAFRELPQLCEHVHLPLQSGSDRILKRMRRAYTRDQYRNLVDELRSAQPSLGLTTDIIVGFPGETEEDYQATHQLAAELEFDNSFVFRYSPRRDTPAATMEEQVSEEVKMQRNQELLALQDRVVEKKNRQLLQSEVEILVEGESKNSPLRFQGRTRQNHLVLIEANERWRGELLPVRIKETTGFTYYAEPVIQE
jgi:tRNA-2-methylthio-N6-dimethylallyladenosine synthase